MISCVSEAGRVEGEDVSEVKFWSVFYEEDIDRRKGEDWGRKMNIPVFVHKEGQCAVQERA